MLDLIPDYIRDVSYCFLPHKLAQSTVWLDFNFLRVMQWFDLPLNADVTAETVIWLIWHIALIATWLAASYSEYATLLCPHCVRLKQQTKRNNNIPSGARPLYNPARYIFQYISKYSSAPCDEGRTVGEVQGHADALVARRGAVWRSLMYPCHENHSPYRLFYVKSTITEGEKTKLSLLWSFVFIALYVETLFQKM